MAISVTTTTPDQREIARLEAELARLRAENTQLRDSVLLHPQLDKLRAENERLKASAMSSQCPRPFSSSNTTVGYCVQSRQCGCDWGQTLTAAPSREELFDGSSQYAPRDRGKSVD
jgi:hypothetical protein